MLDRKQYIVSLAILLPNYHCAPNLLRTRANALRRLALLESNASPLTVAF